MNDIVILCDMEIKNKIKESGIIQLDLNDFRPSITILGIDLSERLHEGLILKEKDFRHWLKEHDWKQYEKRAVFIYCSVDAIIPTWAYMLITSKVMEYTNDVVVGNKTALEKKLIKENIDSLDLSLFQDQRVIIKGCSEVAAPEYAMSALVILLQPMVKSIMYGEPCSSVPVFKKKKT
ncbi:DUF2480 family protein [Crocinitomicaceae bacterium]|jgi:hypothetical protein|nr:DUF2480 family protein [Crocinitomicaceae bacterium]MDC0297302.1 DUF2480 family protein [Crocinitomicaceae bacterium]